MLLRTFYCLYIFHYFNTQFQFSFQHIYVEKGNFSELFNNNAKRIILFTYSVSVFILKLLSK